MKYSKHTNNLCDEKILSELIKSKFTLNEVYHQISSLLKEQFQFYNIFFLIPDQGTYLLKNKNRIYKFKDIPSFILKLNSVKSPRQLESKVIQSFSQLKLNLKDSIITLPLRDPNRQDPHHSYVLCNYRKALTQSKMRRLKYYLPALAFTIHKIIPFENLKRGSKQWERMFEGISDPVFVLDKELKFIKGNPRSEELLKPIKGKSYYCNDLICHSTKICSDCPALLVKTNRKGVPTKVIKHMNNIFFGVEAHPIYSSKKKLQSIIVYCKDRTEQDRLYHQWVQNEKMALIGDLTTGLTNQICEPLEEILNISKEITNWIQQNDHSLSRSTEDLLEIENATKRCQKIISDIMSIVTNDTQELNYIDINDTIEKSLVLIKTELRKITLMKDFEPLSFQILSSSSKLQQVFFNLIRNAIQAMPFGGELRIRTMSAGEGNKILIILEDTGSGIREENITQLFTPFFTTKKESEGTGLGLMICKEIITRLGGDLAITSEYNKGTKVVISLPI